MHTTDAATGPSKALFWCVGSSTEKLCSDEHESFGLWVNDLSESDSSQSPDSWKKDSLLNKPVFGPIGVELGHFECRFCRFRLRDPHTMCTEAQSADCGLQNCKMFPQFFTQICAQSANCGLQNCKMFPRFLHKFAFKVLNGRFSPFLEMTTL
jgi:hypothetical protein